MQSPLLDYVIKAADRIREEHHKGNIGPECVYLAMLDAVQDTGFTTDVVEDNEEKIALQKGLTDGKCPKREDVERYLLSEDYDPSINWFRTFRVWMSMKKRTSVEALIYIMANGLLKGSRSPSSPKGNTAGEHNTSKGPETAEHRRQDQSIGGGNAVAEDRSDRSEGKEGNEEAGQRETSIESLTETTVDLREELLKNIVGQNAVINRFADGYFRGEMHALMEKDREKPRSVFLFTGAPGVGKTFMASEAARILKIEKRRFDMSGYADDGSAFDLTGANRNYKSPKAGDLTGFVEKNPHCILLFDEIEKAHPKVINLFLQVLDYGYLYDNMYEKNISFKDAIVIFTTNAGKQLYEDDSKRDLSDVPENVIINALSKDVDKVTGKPFFPQAICSRLASGNVLLFNKLAASDLIAIAAKELIGQQENLGKVFSVDSVGCENLAPTILYSIGGRCDARSVVGAAKGFFTSEILELYRLARNTTETKDSKENRSKINKINWTIDLEGADDKVLDLYKTDDDLAVLVVGREGRRSMIEQGQNRILYASSPEEVSSLLREQEILLMVIDYCFDEKTDQHGFLNIEDVRSGGHTVFREMIEKYPDIPVFLWETDSYSYNREEVVSFFERGVRGVLNLEGMTSAEIIERIDSLRSMIGHQKGLDSLALRHQVLAYETAQSLSADGCIGEIRVFDFHLSTAIEADERNDVVSAQEKPNVHWDDIIVSEDAKSELLYFMEYLSNPKRFLKKCAKTPGVKAPKGILLFGPPGTGKTSLAKAMATESNVTFLAASADQFFSHWAGDGPQSVHKIFSVARKYAPAILFIDEIDAIGRRRTEEGTTDGQSEILNALLTEMDGFKTVPSKPVLVIAATNLGGNNGDTGALDPALVRRFDRSINIGLPDRDGRIKLLNLLIKKNKMKKISSEEIQSLAERSIGMSPALLEGAVNLAIRDAIRSNKSVDDKILDEAFEKYNNGEEKKWDPDELQKTARHESGHAVVCRYFGERPSYLTVVARNDHGGYMMHSGNEKKGSFTKPELLQRICISMGGRAAEIVYYGKEIGLSTGASGDLENATGIARSMVCRYGMYESVTSGCIPQNTKNQEILEAVNRCVNTVLQEELNRAIEIVEKNRHVVDALSEALIRKTYLNKDQMEEIFNNQRVQVAPDT